jgi:hypothetical protein
MNTRALASLAAAAVTTMAASSPAVASRSQQSIFMDDPKVVFSAPEKLEGTLAEMKALGADRVRVSVFWHLLAPDPNSETRPFSPGAGADPRNYSAEKWDRYDRIVTTAASLGLKVLFNVTSPAPHWATPSPPRADLEDSYRPNADEFGDFVEAVGTRYSGAFADEAVRQDATSLFDDCEPTPNFPVPPELCPPDGSDPGPDNPNPPNTGPILPRVDSWSIWNEPNMPGWLTPQSDEDDNRLAASPHVYRRLADEMYRGLRESGHAGDTILLGETAPRGARERSVTQSLAPLLFIRELYCLDNRFEPFTGDAAERRDCPDGGEGFGADHPVLFNTTAFAHHPYAFDAPPGRSDRTRDHAVLVDLGRLTRTLDRALARHGSQKRYRVWLTEYGYQTDPPDPYLGWSWRKQARFLAHAEWLAYRRPRVRSTAQFLLYDDGPRRDYPAEDPRHWGTFQTGLRTADGEKKAAYAGYQRVIHVPARVRRGRRVRIFGLYRPATAPVEASVQFRRRGRSGWKTVTTARTSRRGFLVVRRKARRSGAFRIRFDAGDRTVRTRAASLRVSR